MMKKQGVKFYLKHKVKEVSAKDRSVSLKADDAKGNELSLEGDYCLVFRWKKAIYRWSWS